VAGHAAEEPFPWGHDEVWGFFVVVEGAKPRPVRALLFEGGASRLDERDEVGFGFDTVDFGVWYSGHFSQWFGFEPNDHLRYRSPRSAGPIGSLFCFGRRWNSCLNDIGGLFVSKSRQD